ncbi:trichoplein keratin filament-binding protein-like isoform X2 [Tachypleus tridentatus]|uniref:trichoplein keratin filament-binding protein-like isoform X2 n=1 Tax=Tachypleus tridentatus TaxID=6853 RepID=UPI003FD2B66A
MVFLHMALPSLNSYWLSKNRKDLVERTIVQKREQQAQRYQTWDMAAQYFKDLDKMSTQYHNLESSIPGTANSKYRGNKESLVEEQNKEEKKKKLEERRTRLVAFLKENNERLETELEERKKREHFKDPWNVNALRQKLEEIKQQRKLEQLQTKEIKLYQHWQQTNPEARQLLSDHLEKNVVQSWGNQLKEKEEKTAREIAEDRLLLATMEQKRIEEENKAAELDKKRKEEAEAWAEGLKKQIEEIKLKELQTQMLKKEESLLMQKQQQIEEIIMKRKDLEKAQEKRKMRIALTKQWTHKLRKKAQEVQEDLEVDKQLLEYLSKEEGKEQENEKAKKERARADLDLMQKMIQEQIKLEKERENESQLLFQEEAERMWQKREAEWERERLAREKLLNEVLFGLKAQMEEKLEQNLKQQQEKLREREELVKEMELATKQSEEEEQNARAFRDQLKKDLESQILYKEQKKENDKHNKAHEKRQEEEVKSYQDSLITKEEIRLQNEGYNPKFHRRKIAWL